jgi:hypothetical protein
MDTVCVMHLAMIHDTTQLGRNASYHVTQLFTSVADIVSHPTAIPVKWMEQLANYHIIPQSMQIMGVLLCRKIISSIPTIPELTESLRIYIRIGEVLWGQVLRNDTLAGYINVYMLTCGVIWRLFLDAVIDISTTIWRDWFDPN